MLERLKNLRDDNRGAILMIGCFFAAFLVGALWYVAGVGNAALFRERMQDGADAAAFAAAVVHARGMNIIAMLNLIMAAILGVLVALKIAKLLLTITQIITSIICALPYGVGVWACPIEVAAGVGKEAVEAAIEVVEPVVNNLLKVFSGLETVVAKVMPVVALAKTNSVAKKYSKPVDGALMISDSLLASGKLGLPVEEDTYKELCKRAGEFVGEFAMLPFSVFGVSGKWAKGLVGGLVSMAPSYFCGDDGGDSGGGSGGSGGSGSGGDKPTNFEQSAKEICDAKQKAIDDANKDLKGKKKISFDYDDCMEEQKKNMKNEESSAFGGAQGGSKKTPKKVIDGAKNGDPHFQINVYAWGDIQLTKSAQKAVELPSWGKKVAFQPPDFWGKIQLSASEFYYDDKGEWDKLKKDAMWNMRWRARLRRFHPENAPAGALTKALSLLSVPGSLLAALDMYNTGELPGLPGELLGGNKERLSDIYVRQAKKTDGGSGYEKVNASQTLEFVH